MSRCARNEISWATTTLAAAAALTALAGWSQPAHADIGACGNIYVEASAECVVVPPSAQCEGMCTPVSVRASCSAKLAAECRGSCDELPSVSCSGRCEASCTASCSDLEPGSFDCSGACRADCSGQCSAKCEGDSDSAGCQAHCEGSCSASCDASCSVEPPKADCDASCEASCKGSCEVDTNLDCQLKCQGEAQLDCEAEVKGGCEIECTKEDGALFCEGQYVDHGDNLQECVDALKAKYNIKITAEASGMSGCDAGVCSASGDASIKANNCSVSHVGQPAGSHGLALFAGLVAALAFSIRRRR